MRLAKHVQYRKEKFGAVVFDTLNEKVYVTNETGGEMLAHIVNGVEADQIASGLTERYAGEPDEIKADVAGFIESLMSAGLLAPSSEGES